MKLSVDSKLLREALSFLSFFSLSKTAAVPSLQGGHLSITPSRLVITTTNLNDTAQTKIEISGKDSWEGVVDIRKAADFLSLVREKTALLETDERKLIIHADGARAELAMLSASDYPLPGEGGKKEFEITKVDLQALLGLVLFSAARDESRPVLTGIRFSRLGDEPCVVSTDGFRMSFVTGVDIPALSNKTISSPVLSYVAKHAKDQKLKVASVDGGKTLHFQLDEKEIYSRTIEGDFPAFERVIPTTHTTRATFSRDELERALKQIAVFSKESTSTVVFKITEKVASIHPRTKTADTVEVMITPKTYEGEPLVVAFNQRFVSEFLSNTTSEEVIFEGTESTSPGVFRLSNNPNYLHIIMPVRLDENR